MDDDIVDASGNQQPTKKPVKTTQELDQDEIEYRKERDTRIKVYAVIAGGALIIALFSLAVIKTLFEPSESAVSVTTTTSTTTTEVKEAATLAPSTTPTTAGGSPTTVALVDRQTKQTVNVNQVVNIAAEKGWTVLNYDPAMLTQKQMPGGVGNSGFLFVAKKTGETTVVVGDTQGNKMTTVVTINPAGSGNQPSDGKGEAVGSTTTAPTTSVYVYSPTTTAAPTTTVAP